MVVIAVGGVALFIAGIAMAVAGLTMGSQFSGATPPPNLAGLGAGQLMGGFGLGLLGVALSASAAALLVDFRFSRPLAVGAAALTALLAAGGVALLGGATRKDPILLVALLLAVLTFGGSAAILARTRH